MSLNPVLMAAHARGMGALGDGPYVDPDSFIGTFGQPPTMTSNGGGGFNWNNFTNVVGGTLSSIFGNRNNASNAAAQQLALLQAQQAANIYRTQQTDNDDDGGGSSFGLAFTDKGLRLGEKTTISYPTLGVAALALFLLQSSGFQKRGR